MHAEYTHTAGRKLSRQHNCLSPQCSHEWLPAFPARAVSIVLLTRHAAFYKHMPTAHQGSGAALTFASFL